jgi:hypothetical protein
MKKRGASASSRFYTKKLEVQTQKIVPKSKLVSRIHQKIIGNRHDQPQGRKTVSELITTGPADYNSISVIGNSRIAKAHIRAAP